MTDHSDLGSTDVQDDSSSTFITDETSADEVWSFDTDQNGVSDVVQWSFGDGTWQELRDVDADGSADVLLVDTDGDDSANLQIWDNGDGSYTVAQDSDGDGDFETQQSFSRDDLDSKLPGISDLLDSRFEDGTEEPAATPGSSDDGSPVLLDTDEDGTAETVRWDFGDGTWQEVVDTDGDGEADLLVIDTDGDGTADFAIGDNGDGTYTAYSTDSEGQWSDGREFSRADIEDALPGVTDLLDSQLEDQGLPPAHPTTDEPAFPSTDEGDLSVADFDEDGTVDTAHWDFGDGSWQEVIDLDGDTNVDLLLVDTNADGTADFAVTQNSDGGYTVYQADENGEWGEPVELSKADLDAALPGVTDLLETTITTDGDSPADTPTDPGDPDNPVDPGEIPSVDDDEVAGNPVDNAQNWFNQAKDGYCVPSSVAMIVSEYTGNPILSEDQFVEMADQMGLLIHDSEGDYGMTYDGALSLMEAAGIPASLEIGDMNTLEQYLEDGRGIMLFIDSGEIWYGETTEDNSADHAVVLTGIDEEAGVAYLNDPGSPDGQMMQVPLSLLEDAWADSDHQMVVCDEPAPNFVDTKGEGAAGAEEPATTQIQDATAEVVQSPWAILPVVLPSESVAPVHGK